jgi:serine/threonine-protein kinase RsbW
MPANPPSRIETTPTQRELTARFSAVPESVPCIRHAVADWARQSGATRSTVDAASLAVTEAVTNVVRHAYPQATGDVEVRGTRDGEGLAVTVRDWGVGPGGAERRTAGAGLGLHIVKQMCDRFESSSPPTGGTMVRMRFAV